MKIMAAAAESAKENNHGNNGGSERKRHRRIMASAASMKMIMKISLKWHQLAAASMAKISAMKRWQRHGGEAASAYRNGGGNGGESHEMA
jgi:hypothetical protein